MSGDPDHGHVAQRVVGRLAGGGVRVARDEDARPPGGDGGGEEAVAVGALAGQGDEQVARGHEPGVDGRAADRAVAAAEEPAAGRREQVVGGQGGVGGGRPSGIRHGRRVSHGPRHG